MLRMNLSIIRSDQITRATEVSDEAMTAAELIIERNKTNLEALIKLTDNSDTEKMTQTGRQMKLGRTIISDFNEAMEMVSSRVTRQELFNALEKQSERLSANFDSDRLLRILHGEEEELMTFAREMLAAKSNRMANFFGGIEENQVANRIHESRARAEEIIEYEKRFGDIDTFENLSTEKGAEKRLRELMRADAQSITDKRTSAVQEAVLNMIEDKENPLAGLDEEQVIEAKRAKAVYGVNELNAQIAEDIQNNLRATGKSVGESVDESKFRKQLRNMLAGEDYSDEVDRVKYKKISKFMQEDLASLFSENKIFRNSIYGMGALIAGSLIYSAVKDRAPENVGGPPLLPGGSAYEEHAQRIPQVPQIVDGSYSPGMSYKVNLYGNRSETEDFLRIFSGFGQNMDVDTTMYPGTPQVGRDPYQEIASGY